MKKLTITAAGACCALLAAGHAPAQNYPSKTVRIIVPYPPGGTSDILSRLLSPKLNEVFGQPIVVDNRPGANGNIGADMVAKSAPDGHTILLADLGALTISPSIYKLPFDPVKDFAPVTMVTYSPHLLAVHPSVPVKTVKELIALAKSKPGLLNFAVSGIGGAPHLAGIAFEAQTGVKWTYIPYKGGSDAIIGLASGQADAIFNGMLATYPHVKSGKLKLIAVSSAKRVASIPDVPTVAEAGLKDFETGLLAGRGRAGRNAERSRQPAQHRDRADTQHAGDEGQPRQAGCRGLHYDIRAARHLAEERNREVGESGQGRQPQARMTRQKKPACTGFFGS